MLPLIRRSSGSLRLAANPLRAQHTAGIALRGVPAPAPPFASARFLHASPPATSSEPPQADTVAEKRGYRPPLGLRRRFQGPQWRWGDGGSPYAVPTPWLGAYYSLRDGDPAAEKKRDKLVGRRAPTRGRFIVGTVDQQEIVEKEGADPWRKGLFQTGDFLQVRHRPTMSDPVEQCVGVVLGRHRKGLGSSFRLLCKPDELAVEYQFMLYSPLLVDIKKLGKIAKKPRTNKIYWMRERVGKLKLPKAERLERSKG